MASLFQQGLDKLPAFISACIHDFAFSVETLRGFLAPNSFIDYVWLVECRRRRRWGEENKILFDENKTILFVILSEVKAER